MTFGKASEFLIVWFVVFIIIIIIINIIKCTPVIFALFTHLQLWTFKVYFVEKSIPK